MMRDHALEPTASALCSLAVASRLDAGQARREAFGEIDP
jgi:hypothetical protein